MLSVAEYVLPLSQIRSTNMASGGDHGRYTMSRILFTLLRRRLQLVD
jgi:hypothetical protein